MGEVRQTATYGPLPNNNDWFNGAFRVKFSMEQQVEIATIQFFFSKLGYNRPGKPHAVRLNADYSVTENASTTPNWFHYWNQTPAGGTDVLYNPESTIRFGTTPSMRYWRDWKRQPALEPLVQQWRGRIWIYDRASGRDTRRDGSGQEITGIDLFANTVAHERRHVQQFEAGEAAVAGWSWGVAPTDPLWNHETHDQDQDDLPWPMAGRFSFPPGLQPG